MALGKKYGGRTAGTPNRRTQDIASQLAKLKCDPIEGMARIAANPKASLELRGRMYAELASYIHPKRKAVEHTGEGGGPINGKIEVVVYSVLDPPKEVLES